MFADPAIGFAPPLAAAALEAARRVAGVTAVALVDAGAAPWSRLDPWRRAAGALLARLAGPAPGWPRSRPWPPPGLPRLARRHGVRLVVPPDRDVNRPELVAELCGHLGANLALSVGCRQVFRPPLLAAFEVAANFHDGLLPAYRGLGATAWSLYHDAAVSGYSFHRMEAGIDTGPVLLDEALPVADGAGALAMLRAKTARAAGRMDEVLGCLIERRPGRTQAGGGAYYGERERREVTAVAEPGSLAWDELRRRLHAFGLLRLELAGRSWEVSALRPVAGRPGRLAFTTRDGVVVEPYRFRHLPRPLFEVAELLAGRRRA